MLKEFLEANHFASIAERCEVKTSVGKVFVPQHLNCTNKTIVFPPLKESSINMRNVDVFKTRMPHAPERPSFVGVFERELVVLLIETSQKLPERNLFGR